MVDGSALDHTLRQVLSELYGVSNERDQYRAILVELNKKLEDAGYLLERLNELRAQAGQPPVTMPAPPEGAPVAVESETG